ncbi:MAG TPA: TIGR04290 family methyltransferase [Thermoanaerobaculia bacterium]|nr:TIGR04290 family methyltransferase [Thermoanaerobaculia bacterium]
MTTDLSIEARSSLADEIAALGPWFHNLHLPDGTQTIPDHFLGDFPTFKWEQIRDHLPADLAGWTALDIGCNAGFYSFELARRGALVTGIDHDPHYLEQARWAVRQYGLADRVRFEQMQVYDLAATPEQWDLVLFMGVLYHLRYPLLGLDVVARKVRRRMIFQTLTMPGEEVCEPPADLPIDERDAMLAPGWPKMAFIERRLAHDPTNWWAPNHAAVEAMLRSAGLAVLERPGHEIYVCEPAPPQEETAGIEAELRVATGRPLPLGDGGDGGSGGNGG